MLLRDELVGDQVQRRRAMLGLDHVAPLARFTAEVRAETGYVVPEFDPLDGGVNATALFLLEAPGPKAVSSGFVSRNNPDPTARRCLRLHVVAGFAREQQVLWNVVPWYIGEGAQIRSARISDLRAGSPYVVRLLALLPRLRVVVLVGRRAQAGWLLLRPTPDIEVVRSLHPSQRVINTRPSAEAEIIAAWSRAASFCGEVDH